MSDSTIGSTSQVGSSYQADFQSKKNQFQQSMSSLTSSINSGDMSTAQTTLNQILQSAPKGSKNSGDSTISKDFQTLQAAVNSGDAAKAKAALQQLQSDMKAAAAAHHPKKKSKEDGDSDESASATSSSTGTDSSGSTSSTLNAQA